VWTSARDLARYVEMELAKGMLPGGKRLVSAENLLARYQPKVLLGEDATYGMALMVEKRYGVPVVHHGGDLPGYHSDMIWLPDHGVGAVILTNADSGVILRGLLQRRLLEVLFDGKPEAEETLVGAVARRKAAIAKERERLVVPADPEAVAGLAGRYASKELGEIRVVRSGKATVFDAGEWKSAVASRKNDDGTISFITIDPAVAGFEFVVADRDGKRRMITRDAQHEYVFLETGT
jgi:CubicO group peptidase (beta-lactamase class C family)